MGCGDLEARGDSDLAEALWEIEEVTEVTEEDSEVHQEEASEEDFRALQVEDQEEGLEVIVEDLEVIVEDLGLLEGALVDHVVVSEDQDLEALVRWDSMDLQEKKKDLKMVLLESVTEVHLGKVMEAEEVLEAVEGMEEEAVWEDQWDLEGLADKWDREGLADQWDREGLADQ